MSAGHLHHFYVDRDTVVHRIAPEAKVVATFVFVIAVVATPREAFWAFGVDAAFIATVAVLSQVAWKQFGRRMLLELPFLTFAVFMPIVGGGERTEVAGFSLSIAGLWGAWNIVVKGALGVAAAVVLTSTTSGPELLRALERLRVPSILVQITSFMVRYLEVIASDMRRMKIARESRGSGRRRWAQLKAVSISAGALFIRSFERGERVHMAMLARGFDGRLHVARAAAAPRSDWLSASVAPVLAVAVCSVAWSLQ